MLFVNRALRVTILLLIPVALSGCFTISSKAVKFDPSTTEELPREVAIDWLRKLIGDAADHQYACKYHANGISDPDNPKSIIAYDQWNTLPDDGAGGYDLYVLSSLVDDSAQVSGRIRLLPNGRARGLFPDTDCFAYSHTSYTVDNLDAIRTVMNKGLTALKSLGVHVAIE